MKKQSIIQAIFLAGALLFLGAAAFNPPMFDKISGDTKPVVQAQSTGTTGSGDCNTSRTIQVSGTGVVNVTPDRVLIELGVQSSGSTPDGTQSANFTSVQRVTGAIRSIGIDAKDIATEGYIVYPVYDDSNSLVIKGYRIDNTVSITVRDITKVDNVMIAAFNAGANEVQNVEFYTSELRKYRDQARSMAVKAAGEKAQALATDGGAQAGCLVNASENTWSQYFGSWGGGRNMALWTQNAVQNANNQGNAQGSDDTLFSLGQIAVQAQVSATYSLK